MKNIVYLTLIAIIMSMTACAGYSNEKNYIPSARPLPSQNIQPAVAEPVNLDGSLWQERGGSIFFKDMRAHMVGDLVTVNIVETASASKQAGTQTSRDSSIDGGINSLLGWETQLNRLTSLGNNDVANAFDNTSMFDASMTNGFSGSGSTSRNESMTASITAKVVEVLPNGNLFIQGTREVRVNKETQYIVLSGLVRPVDISPNNTVLSSYIGDAKIEYMGRGPVSDKQRPGWLTRAVDFVWPF